VNTVNSQFRRGEKDEQEESRLDNASGDAGFRTSRVVPRRDATQENRETGHYVTCGS
jgi:hypothetical protein